MLACIIEDNHDGYGPLWPAEVAPWQVHICVLGGEEDTRNRALCLYRSLSRQRSVLIDDRRVSAGVQFADADLLGAPVRIVLGGKSLAGDQVEIVTRDRTCRKVVHEEETDGILQEVIGKTST